MGILSIASLGLFIGAIGQMAIYARLFPRGPDWLVLGILFIPWLTVFVISFCREAPFGPRPFRCCLIFAMCWYSALTLLAEMLFFCIQPAPNGHFSLIVARVLIYLFGAASFFVFIRTCIAIRRYETKTDA
jgi:hypothetical protein